MPQVYAYRKGEPGPVTSSATTGLAVYAFIWYLVYGITISSAWVGQELGVEFSWIVESQVPTGPGPAYLC